MAKWPDQYVVDTILAKEAKTLKEQNKHNEAEQKLKKQKFQAPDSANALLEALENPHIPTNEILSREEGDYIQFEDDEKAMQVLEIKLGKVPEWLHQRFKSKWKKPKETAEEKEERHQKQLEEHLLKKAEASNKAREEFIVTVGNLPESNAHIQDKRNWDLELFNKMLPLLSSPRAKKKARQYVSTRRAQSTARQHKQHMVKHLTTLKEEGGLLEGGTHKDTYDAKLKQKVKKKEDKKEKKAKEKQVKETKKKL